MPFISAKKYNEAFVKIECDVDVARRIKNLFSCFSPGYKFSPKFRECLLVKDCPTPKERSSSEKCCRFKCPNFARAWNGRISAFKLTNYLLPIGLYEDFIDWANKYNYNIGGCFLPTKGLYEDKFFEKFYATIFENSNIYPRDYQHEAIKAAINNRIGIIEHATGSGKTSVEYSIIRFLLAMNKRVCVVVPNIMLVEQLRAEFKGYGWANVDDHMAIMYTGEEPDLNKPILVSTFQSLVKKNDSYLSRFQGVLIDEAHYTKSKSVKDILDRMTKAEYRIGLTGSLPDNEDQEEALNNMTIKGCLGKVIAQKPASELIDEGVLSKITIINLILKYPDIICRKVQSMDYEGEKEFINENRMRYKAIDLILNNTPKEENTLILCTERQYLDDVNKYIDEKFKDKFVVRKIHGKIKIKKRLEVQQEMEDESGIITVATYGTLSTGVNIKRLHNLICLSSYKSKIKIIQTIGRGLRLLETKN